jgi:glycosyltransferase involved in cell wall biosynthesis
MLAQGIDVNIVDISTSSSRTDYLSLQSYFSRDFIHPISLFFISPFSYARFLSTHQGKWLGDYKIGNFLWELADFPRSWGWVLAQVDEIWTPTTFVARTYEAASAKTCYLNPTPAVPLINTNRSFRRKFGIFDEVFTFGFMFDLHSTLSRKNPMALLHAYEKCRLLLHGRVESALLIKVHRADMPSNALVELKAYAARIPGVRLYEETLAHESVVDFYNTIDAYVSLHRSEGLGRTLIEARQQGLPTICTNYSGERDIAELTEIKSVPYRLVPCTPKDYPNSEGSEWADASIEHAAVLMAQTARQGRTRTASPDRLNEHFSADGFARRTLTRLEQLK